MKAILVFYCLSGFGDQYSNILTGHRAYNDLKKLGYNVEIYWMVRNIYFSSDLPLDYIFNFDYFVKEGVKINYINNESQIPEQYQFVNTNQSAIKVFVSKVIEELNNYTLPVFDIYRYHNNSVKEFNLNNLPDFENQFVSQECLKIAKHFLKGKKKVKAIHFRTSDDLNQSNYEDIIKDGYYKERIESGIEFINNNKKYNIMICSNNKSIRDFFVNNFENTFYNKFDFDFEMHHSYNRNFGNEENIRHSQQVVAEMVALAKCEEIFTVGKMMSNFLTYAITHNVHHKNWETKMKKLLV